MDENNNKGLKQRTMQGFLWMLSGSGIQSIMQFVVLIVLARLLDPESYGIASAAIVVISFTKILATLGFGPALVQKKDINETHIGTSYTGSLILAIFFGIVVYFSSPIVASFFSMEDLKLILKVMSFVFVLQGFAMVSESLIQRDLLFNYMVRIQVISYLFYGITGTLFAFMGFGVWALIIAYISQFFVKAVVSFYLQPYKFKLSFNMTALKELLYFSGGYSIAKLSSEVSNQGDNFIIGRFLGADSLGLYSRAYQLMVTPANLIGKVLEKVLFPVMSKIQDNLTKLAYVYGEGIRLTTTFMLPTSVLLAIQAENIILLLFGDQWIDLKVPFQILALSLLFRSSYKISDSLSKAKGAVYYRAVVKWIFAFLVLICSYIGQLYGLEGVAIGVSIAIFSNYLLMTSLAVQLTKIKMKSLIHTHIGGFLLAFVFYMLTLPFDILITNITNHFIIELGLYIILFVIVFIIGVLIQPRLFIGSEGEQAIKKLIKKYL